MFLDDHNSQAQPGPRPIEIADEGEVIVQPRFAVRDVADRLPAKARRRLIALRDQRDDAQGAYSTATAKLREQTDLKNDAERRLKFLKQPTSFVGRVEEESPAARELNAQIATCKAEIERLREVVEVRAARATQIGSLVRNLEKFVGEIADNARVIAAPALAARPAKGEDIVSAIERRRARLRELTADAHRVKSAPIPSSVAKAQARAQIDALAERGAIEVAPLVEAGKPFRLPQAFASIVTEGSAGRAVATLWHTDVDGVLAWLFRDEIVTKIEAEIEACADDANALSTQQRSDRLDEIASDRLLVEREEESLIEAAERKGLAVMRRPDADARAVLGIAVREDESK